MSAPRKDRLGAYLATHRSSSPKEATMAATANAGLRRSVRTPKRMSLDMSRHSFYAMFCDVY